MYLPPKLSKFSLASLAFTHFLTLPVNSCVLTHIWTLTSGWHSSGLSCIVTSWLLYCLLCYLHLPVLITLCFLPSSECVRSMKAATQQKVWFIFLPQSIRYQYLLEVEYLFNHMLATTLFLSQGQAWVLLHPCAFLPWNQHPSLTFLSALLCIFDASCLIGSSRCKGLQCLLYTFPVTRGLHKTWPLSCCLLCVCVCVCVLGPFYHVQIFATR